MKDRTILIIAVILLALFFGARYYFSLRQSPDFSAPLIQIDTAAVTTLFIAPPGEETEIALRREDGNWIASNGQIHLKTSQDIITAILGAIANVRTTLIVTQKPGEWADYDVLESTGTRVRVYEGQKLLEDFIVGKTQTTPEGLTFTHLRLTDEDEVYAINGSLKNIFKLNFNDFRSKQILNIISEVNIGEFEWQSPDTLLQFQRTDTGWRQGEMILDSLKVEKYLRSLRNISGNYFADDFDEVQDADLLFEVLTIPNNQTDEPFVISCYRDTTRQMPFIIHSSQNRDAYFSSDSTDIYQRIFKNLRILLPSEK